MPKVSVIVPSYNQGKYLAEALESVRLQDFNDFECIVVDDGSVDDSVQVATDFLSADNRFKLIRTDNQGVSAARNKAIECARGEFILPLDGDDKLSENYLSELYNSFALNPDTSVVYARGYKFGLIVQEWSLANYSLENMIFSNMIHVSGMYRKTDWQDIGGYDTAMRDGLEDWEFWISLLKKGGKVMKVETATLFYRVKTHSRMTSISLQTRYRLLAYIIFKHQELYQKYIDDPNLTVNINFAYAFLLSAQIYHPHDLQKVDQIKQYYHNKLKAELKKYTFIKRKRMLWYWSKRGKLNISFWDVLIK